MTPSLRAEGGGNPGNTTSLVPDALECRGTTKAGSRTKKLALIETGTPQWRDLYPESQP